MSSYWKTVIRSIKNSFARFAAILAIIALGVGFYSGLSLTMPCFLETGDRFVGDHDLYDLRLISTIGFDDEDIEKLRTAEGVEDVSGAYLQDAMVYDPKDPDQVVSVVRFHSVTEGINIPEVTAGRMPQAGNEVVVDGYRCPDSMIGSTLLISESNDKDTKNAFSYTEYTVVGTVRSPYYLNFQRGTTDVGGGTVTFYAYIPESGFDMEYYTECFVDLINDDPIYSDDYEEFSDRSSDEMEILLQDIIDERFDDLMEEKRQELQDASDELEEARADALEELEDARQELLDAHQDIIDAQDELDDARDELDDADSTLTNARADLDDALDEINEGRQAIEDGEDEIDEQEQQLLSQEAQLTDAKTQLETGIATANSTLETLQATKTELETTIETLTTSLETVNASIEAIEELPEDERDQDTLIALTAQKTQLDTGLTEAQTGLTQTEAGIATATATIADLQTQLDQVNTGLSQVAAGKVAIEEARDELEEAREELENGIAEYESGLSDYNSGLSDYNSGLSDYNDGVEELNDGIEEYLDGQREYYEGLVEYQDEISSGYRALGFGYAMLNDIDDPETFVLDRRTNVGYVSFDNDAHIVDGIARVFPIFFFALAALVCSTTMQRMVADERMQIGSMRAMGYSGFSIIMKYVIYAGLASVIGCTAGYLGGVKLFPYVIWQVYGMMYGFAPIVFVGSIKIFLLSLFVSLVCSVGVTVVTALSELSGTPAELMRPKSPPAGKRIILERIGFIWKRLRFTHKVSIRNVFRFKKRMWMMIIGIAGCTALLITGFGIKDSIDGIVDYQYDNITVYDIEADFKDGTSVSSMEKALKDTDAHFGVGTDSALIRIESVTHNGPDIIRDVTLMVSDDPGIGAVLIGESAGEKMPWPSDGKIAISSKLADKCGIGPGDDITLSYGDMGESFTCEVEYVFDNYIYHYAFMNGTTYEAMFGEAYEPSTFLITREGDNSPEATGITDYDYASYLAGNKNVKSWSVVSEMRSSFRETMTQLNKVVILIIGCAAALAFIVLFNLNNINITERIREIATIKVLGFDRVETGSYVFRENFILVFMGFIFGIPLGIALHRFVIAQIEMDTVTFICRIFPISYVYSLGFVILFSVIVDLVMRRKIDRIDMAESLKSVE